MSSVEQNTEILYEEDEAFRDSLATVDKAGKRIWIYPKKPTGRFYNYRKWVSYFLLLVLFGLPWLKLNGEPMFLINILERKFILFGVYFTTQDFHLFVIGMLIFVLVIALFTVVFGRLFCGWVCPQTIFMEMVYRQIEYWIEGDANAQRRLSKQKWSTDKILKKSGKHIIFFFIAILIANTFLAYIIGIDEVLSIATDPIDLHWQGFLAMLIFSLVFYTVFSVLREQVCTTICPYGRLQGVLLDDKSQAVYYDFVRGEPRAKIRKGEDQGEKGDCIDCKLCIHVCPTGIDIRNGIQLECVNCTACMDACDEVMEKVHRPKGLIRITSLEGITKKVNTLFSKRAIAYSVILLILLVLESFLFMNRSKVEVLLLRTPGTNYFQQEEGIISNLYNYQLINKTSEEFPVEFRVVNMMNAEIEVIGISPTTIANNVREGALFIKIPRADLDGHKTKLKIQVFSGDQKIDEVNTIFAGPLN